MSIDEAIAKLDLIASDAFEGGNANEFRQLAEWLKALKEIWDSGDCNDCRNGQCEWKPRLGHLVRYNCPHYVDIANGEVNADEDSD